MTSETATDTSAPEREDAFRAGKSAAENRWLLGLVGIVTVVAGVIALAMPFLASLTAALLAGWVLIASGVVGLVTAVRRDAGWSLAASFALSLVSILAGVMTLVLPGAGLLALTTLLIAYFAVSGALRVYYGARAVRDGGGWMVAAGVLSLVLAILLFFGLPFSAVWVPGVMLGVDLVLLGALQIALAVRAGKVAPASDGHGAERHA
ncbi:HdeD family acid-resistance protein [Tateyamaria omphalii]|uniref:HdeD protein n=1 Tax=Tateyamaria omphalii TaxID=299262 RepID=A0A1P8MRD0_9RHOB|nr:DUF308 domain-containing protein [Tateyamaria omphalii]APX10543.1 hypothetical protein BWR18_01650 [Tateyamaria omphalii]